MKRVLECGKGEDIIKNPPLAKNSRKVKAWESNPTH